MTTPATGHLEEPVRVALRELRAAFPDARICLIGARALAFHVPMTRPTADIDVVLTVGLDELEAAEKKLTGWQRRHPPKWVASNGVQVDIVPASAAALAKRELVWRDGLTMNLAGIAIALENLSHVLSDAPQIAIAPVPIIALLKMAAYRDRPYEREKDLGDLANILNDYPLNDDDRLFEGAFFDAGLTEEQRRGTILAREIAALTDAADRAVVTAFIAMMHPDSPHWSRFVSASPWRNDEDRLALHFDAFRERFELALAPADIGTPPSTPEDE